MNHTVDPHQWTLREWLAYMLLAAADVDKRRAVMEMRYVRVELGNEVVDKMLALQAELSEAEHDRILREALPIFLGKRDARAKLQRLLRDIFLADGEYGPEEQALTRKIGDWIRNANS